MTDFTTLIDLLHSSIRSFDRTRLLPDNLRLGSLLEEGNALRNNAFSAADYMTRQQAEIERLTILAKANNDLARHLDAGRRDEMGIRLIGEVKAEAEIERLRKALQSCANAPFSGWTIAQAEVRLALQQEPGQ